MLAGSYATQHLTSEGWLYGDAYSCNPRKYTPVYFVGENTSLTSRTTSIGNEVGTCNGSSCDVALQLGENDGQQLGNSPSHLFFENMTFHGEVRAENGNGTINGITLRPAVNVNYVHDQFWDTSTGADGGSGELAMVWHSTVYDSIIGPLCCGDDGSDLSPVEPYVANPNDITYSHTTFIDIADSCRKEPARVITYWGCTGVGFGDNGTGDHIDGLQALGVDNLALIDDNFYDAGCQAVFLDGIYNGYGWPSFDNGLIQGTTVYGESPGCGVSQQGLLLGGDTGYDTMGGNWKLIDDSTDTNAPVVFAGCGSDSANGCNSSRYVGTWLDGSTLTLANNEFLDGLQWGWVLGQTSQTLCYLVTDTGDNILPAFLENEVGQGANTVPVSACAADYLMPPTAVQSAESAMTNDYISFAEHDNQV